MNNRANFARKVRKVDAFTCLFNPDEGQEESDTPERKRYTSGFCLKQLGHKVELFQGKSATLC